MESKKHSSISNFVQWYKLYPQVVCDLLIVKILVYLPFDRVLIFRRVSKFFEKITKTMVHPSMFCTGNLFYELGIFDGSKNTLQILEYVLKNIKFSSYYFHVESMKRIFFNEVIENHNHNLKFLSFNLKGVEKHMNKLCRYGKIDELVLVHQSSRDFADYSGFRDILMKTKVKGLKLSDGFSINHSMLDVFCDDKLRFPPEKLEVITKFDGVSRYSPSFEGKYFNPAEMKIVTDFISSVNVDHLIICALINRPDALWGLFEPLDIQDMGRKGKIEFLEQMLTSVSKNPKLKGFGFSKEISYIKYLPLISNKLEKLYGPMLCEKVEDLRRLKSFICSSDTLQEMTIHIPREVFRIPGADEEASDEGYDYVSFNDELFTLLESVDHEYSAKGRKIKLKLMFSHLLEYFDLEKLVEGLARLIKEMKSVKLVLGKKRYQSVTESNVEMLISKILGVSK